MRLENKLMEDFLAMENKGNLFDSVYIDRVKKIRPEGRASDGSTVSVDYDNLEGFEGSTHMFSHGESDGKFYAWPTLFPGYDNKETQETEAWGELETWEAFDEAQRRDELFEFHSLDAAEDFAKGSWKNK